MTKRYSIRALALFALVTVLVATGVLVSHRQKARRTAAQLVVDEVPAAAALFDARGSLHRRADGGWSSVPQPASTSAPLLGAPARADGAFEVRARGSSRSLGLRFAGALAAAGHAQGGTVTYRDAYPGVDVVAASDPGYVELAYVVRERDATLRPALAFSGEVALSADPGGGATVRSPDGRAMFRIQEPVAFDSRGSTQRGRYRVQGGELAIELDWSRLVAPVVIDPKVVIPVWTPLSDDRVPGGKVYDPVRLSLETQMVRDTVRNRTIAVRPSRSQQMEDRVLLFGRMASQSLRTPQGTAGADDAQQQWNRGVELGSETWEWDGARWSIVAGATLPGLIDPAMGFDPRRGRVVLFGGAPPSMLCFVWGVNKYYAGINYGCTHQPTALFEGQSNKVYEYDGQSWTERSIPGAPDPRLRASFGWDSVHQRLVLFGGRGINFQDTVYTDGHASVFPENLARELLNDTWTYDGEHWERIPTGNPPAAREGAALVEDPIRHRMVLVGGHVQGQADSAADRFSLWEFDGTDWAQRVAEGDPSAPADLRNRRGVSAFWNPVRKRVQLFGGREAKRAACALTDTEIEQQVQLTSQDPAGRAALAATGCLGGYIQDLWEWDGTALTAVAHAAFGEQIDGTPVFRMVAQGLAPWAVQGPGPETADGGSASVSTPLLAYRYDPRADHFKPRTHLERAHLPASGADAGTAPPPQDGTLEPAQGPVVFASPAFAPTVRAAAFFDAASSELQVVCPEQGRVHRFNGELWNPSASQQTPFSAGPLDFFAAVWAGAQQQLLLFDPTTGQTWSHTPQNGWQRQASAAGPPRWSLPAAVRTEAELPIDPSLQVWSGVPQEFGVRSRLLARELPRMAYDRARGTVVMLYGSALWQWDGTGWSPSPAPTPLQDCKAAALLGYDPLRQRVVAFGCTVPAQTWEWDGQSWAGPFEGPYQAKVVRDDGTEPWSWWKASLQLAWVHPNAAVESATLGLSTFDADGTLRSWNGSQWLPGPRLPEGYLCEEPSSLMTLPWRGNHLRGQDYRPHCFFPPAVEDASSGQILAFRNGYAATRVLDLSRPPESRAWGPLETSTTFMKGMGFGISLVNPHPPELAGADHLYLLTQGDPSSFEPNFADPPDPWWMKERELSLQNLLWPYRLLPDQDTQRIRMLTSRGMLWELGTEKLSGYGEPCASDHDCGRGGCSQEGVCCDDANCGWNACSTCKGSQPGSCEFKTGPVADDDENPCTVFVCEPGGVLSLQAVDAASCDDGNPCNGVATCQGFECVAGAAPDTDDGNPCTQDGCDPTTGISHSPLAAGAACADGNACNGSETCDGSGQCVAGPAPAIDDGNPCTTDSCDPAQGVLHAALGGSGCSDKWGRAGTCSTGGGCEVEVPPELDDGNPCTVDMVVAGVEHHDPTPGESCSDGDVCNGVEQCGADGTCLAGTALAVDDGDANTIDVCDPENGVIHALASAIDPSIATTLAEGNRFLYAATPAIQVGVAPGTIDEPRMAVITGRVVSPDGAPLGGVRVWVPGHPELGKTATMQDGRFLLATNGGTTVVLSFEKPGRLTSTRTVTTTARRYAAIQDVALVTRDDVVTPVDGGGATVVARGAPHGDGQSQRQPTLVFAADTNATLRLSGGATQEIDKFKVRITEYSVGGDGGRALPATPPAWSSGSYAVEFGVDEVERQKATSIEFDKPVAFYLENLAGAPVGAKLPALYFDRQRGVWVPSDPGLVVRVVSVDGGSASLDVDGDQSPDDQLTLASLGITDDELQRVADLYQPGQSVWRVGVKHFSPWLFGWVITAPECALVPGPEPQSKCGVSLPALPLPYTDVRPQAETMLPVHNAPVALSHSTQRTPASKGSYKLVIPLRGTQELPGLQTIKLRVSLAGRWEEKEFPPTQQSYTFVWDGEDWQHRKPQGEPAVLVEKGYAYPCEFLASGASGVPASATPMTFENTDSKSDCRAILWRSWTGTMGVWDVSYQGFGGFGLSALHAYDPGTGKLFTGYGGTERIENVAWKPERTGGGQDPGVSSELVPAKDALFNSIADLEAGPDGTVYVSDNGNTRIARIRADGLVETLVSGVQAWKLALGPDGSLYFTVPVWSAYNTVLGSRVWKRTPSGVLLPLAGDGQGCPIENMVWTCQGADCHWSWGPGSTYECGHGELAGDAHFSVPGELAVSSAGRVFVADPGTRQVQVIEPDGKVYRLAGRPGVIPDPNFLGDGSATSVQLNAPLGLVSRSDGSLLLLDGGGLNNWFEKPQRLRVVNWGGKVGTLANAQMLTGCAAGTGDGKMATDACLRRPSAMAAAPDGSIFVMDERRIRRIDAEGVITTIADEQAVTSGDSCDAAISDAALQRWIDRSISVDRDGTVYWVNGCFNQRIMRMATRPPEPGPEIKIPSRDGSAIYVFSSKGRHLRTEDAILAFPIATFQHTQEGKPAAISDAFGNSTTIERDGSGNATAVKNPEGVQTGITLAAGKLSGVQLPEGMHIGVSFANERLGAVYYPGAPSQHWQFVGDELKRLSDADDGEVGLQFARPEHGYELTTTSGMGRTATEKVVAVPGQPAQATVTVAGLPTTATSSDEGKTWSSQSPDGTGVVGKREAHPMFGWRVPVDTWIKVLMPSGKFKEVSRKLEPTFADAEQTQLSKLVETITTNGKSTIREIDPVAKVVKVRTPLGREYVTTLNHKGQPWVSTSPGVIATTYSHQADGRLGGVSSGERSTSATYEMGYLKSTTDALGQPTIFNNDGLGRPWSVTLPGGSTLGIGYDTAGQADRITPPGKSEHRFTFDSSGLPLKYESPGPSGPLEQWHQQFNPDHQPTLTTYPGGSLLEVGYDTRGRLETVTIPGRVMTVAYHHLTGNVESVSTSAQSQAFGYDGSLVTSASWSGIVNGVLEWTYDGDLRVSGQRLNGSEIGLQYDADDLLTQMGALGITRHAQTGRIAETNLGQVHDERSYNAHGEVETYSAYGPAQGQDDGGGVVRPTLYSVVYERDNAARVTLKTETVGQETHAYQYDYDLRGRLLGTRQDSGSWSWFTYDDNGNRLEEGAQYDEQDRLTSRGGVSYQYDTNGRLWKKGAAEYHYDVTGALLYVVLPGKTVTYEVDGAGRRIRRHDGETDRRYLYQDALRIAAELDGPSQVLSRFVWGTRANVPEYMERGGQSYRFVTDQVGSVRLVVNAQTGEVAQRIDYDAWGKVLSDSNPGFQPFGFAGGLYDRDTGLVRFGARDYDPEIGRWTARDPILFAGEDSNLFVYCGADPVNFIDPDGKFAWAPVALGAMVIAALAIDSSEDTAGHMNLIPAALGPLVPAKVWLGAAVLSTTQIQSSDDIGGMMTTAGLAAASLMTSSSTRTTGGGVSAAGRLTAGGLRSYLANVGSRSRAEVISDLQSVGLKVKGSSPDGRFMEFVDDAGRVRAKIHPSDRATPTSHLHIYDKAGRPLDANLRPVSPWAPEAHIPIQ